MKRIALTQRLVKNTSYFEIREMLDIQWGNCLEVLGFEPVILPLRYDFKRIQFDGLILTGGNDISSISHNEIDAMRDNFETDLLDHCISAHIPVLGICRGMQMINEYFGGTLKKVEHHAGVTHLLDNGKTVNSYHNYGIEKTGTDLQIVAKSLDGIIEIITHKTYPIYAQMAHPERNTPFDAADLVFMKQYFGGTA